MTEYQLELVVSTYFDVLMNRGIKETEVQNFYQRQGTLHIVLENGQIIKEKIKNFYN